MEGCIFPVKSLILKILSKNYPELSYPDLAAELFVPFFGSDYKKEDILSLVKKSYLAFPKPPLKLMHLEQHSVLELFHGPTFSFKDYAMQFLGNLFEIRIKQKKQTTKYTRSYFWRHGKRCYS